MLLDYHQLVRFTEVMCMAKHEFGIMNEVIPFFRADFAPTAFMLYGHVHQTIEYEYIAKLRREIKSNAAGHGTPQWKLHQRWLHDAVYGLYAENAG